VNVLYKWQWRPNDGTYEDFDEEQCIEIEINWRKRLSLVRVCNDFDETTNSIAECN